MKSREEHKIERYTRKIAKNPRDPSVYYKRGKIWLELQQYRRAAIDFNAAIKLEPENSELFYYRGLAYLGKKEYQRSIEEWSRAIDLKLQSSDIYIYRGQAYAKIQAYERAIKDFTKSIEINPKCAIAYCNRASVYFVRENYELALKDYERTLYLEPQNKLAIFNRSIAIDILEKQGKKINRLLQTDIFLAKQKRKFNKKHWRNYNYSLKIISILAIGYTALETIPNAKYNSLDKSLEALKQKNERQIDKTHLNLKENDFKIKKSSVSRGIFNYGGSTVWGKIRERIEPEISNANPDFTLRYLPHPILNPSSSVGIKMLIQNQLDFAQSSRPLTVKEIKLAKENGIELQQIPIAIDGIAIATNPNLKISGLSISQLRDIYSGKITNWQEVGGPDLEIIAYSKPPEKSGTADYFIKNVLGDREFGSTIKLINSTAKGLKIVNKNRGAIFYESAAKIIPQCSVKAISIGYDTERLVAPYQKSKIKSDRCVPGDNQVNLKAFRDASYPLTQKLYVIIKKNGGLEEEIGLSYTNILLSESGQKALEAAGFVSIR